MFSAPPATATFASPSRMDREARLTAAIDEQQARSTRVGDAIRRDARFDQELPRDGAVGAWQVDAGSHLFDVSRGDAGPPDGLGGHETAQLRQAEILQRAAELAKRAADGADNDDIFLIHDRFSSTKQLPILALTLTPR